MIKIVHVINYYTDKIKYQEYYLVKEQLKMGYEVHIVTSCLNFPYPNYESTMLPVLGERKMDPGIVKDENGATLHRLDYYFEFRGRVFMKNVLNIIKGIDPDYIICHGIVNIFGIQLLYYRNENCKLIFDDHMLKVQIDQGIPANLLYGIYRKFFRRKLEKRANKIVAIADNCAETIETVYGVQKERIEVISLGADADLFHINEAFRNQVRQRYDISDEALVVTFTGKLISRKKPHMLIDALENIKEKLRGREVVLLFVGNLAKEYSGFFRDRIAQTSFRCIHIDNLDAEGLCKALNAADVAVWPEEATISTLEASACGLPVVCPAHLTERFKNKNGIGIAPGSLEQLSDALTLLLTDDNMRKDMGLRGRELIKKELSWEIISRRFLE